MTQDIVNAYEELRSLLPEGVPLTDPSHPDAQAVYMQNVGEYKDWALDQVRKLKDGTGVSRALLCNSREDLQGLIQNRKRGDAQLDLSGLDLSGMSFRDVDFADCPMRFVIARNTSFSYAAFQWLHIDYAVFTDSIIEHSVFNDVTFGRTTVFHGVNFAGSEFLTCHWNHPVIKECSLEDALLLDSHIAVDDLGNTKLSQAALVDSSVIDSSGDVYPLPYVRRAWDCEEDEGMSQLTFAYLVREDGVWCIVGNSRNEKPTAITVHELQRQLVQPEGSSDGWREAVSPTGLRDVDQYVLSIAEGHIKQKVQAQQQ